MTQSQDRTVQVSSDDIALSSENIAFTISLGLIWLLGSIVLIIPPFTPLVFVWTPICINFLMGGIAYQVVNELENTAPKTLKQKLNKTWSFIRSRWVSLSFASWIFSITIAIVFSVLVLFILIITRIPGIGSFLGSLLIIPVFVCVLAMFALLINSYLLPCIVGVEKSGLIPSIKFLVNAATKNPFQLLKGYLGVIVSIVPTALLSGIITVIATLISLSICKYWLVSQGTNDGSFPLGFLDSLFLGLICFAWASYMLASISSGFTILYYNASRRRKSFSSYDAE